MTVNQLTFFTVTGYYYDTEAPATSGSISLPQVLVVSAFVEFTPRLRPGAIEYITSLDLGFTIPPPANLSLVPSTTGGSFTAGVKYWVITATTANGETIRSNEVTATLTGTTSSATLSWPVVSGAAGYKVYRGTTSATENLLITTINSGTTLTYLDTGTAGTSATPPTSNTAELTANTALAIAPIQARILNGQLQTIDVADTPNVQLLANTAVLGLGTTLIYDVAFTNVVYASNAQTISNFAFVAPTTNTTVDLGDPALTRLPYAPISA